MFRLLGVKQMTVETRKTVGGKKDFIEMFRLLGVKQIIVEVQFVAHNKKFCDDTIEEQHRAIKEANEMNKPKNMLLKIGWKKDAEFMIKMKDKNEDKLRIKMMV